MDWESKYRFLVGSDPLPEWWLIGKHIKQCKGQCRFSDFIYSIYKAFILIKVMSPRYFHGRNLVAVFRKIKAVSKAPKTDSNYALDSNLAQVKGSSGELDPHREHTTGEQRFRDAW